MSDKNGAKSKKFYVRSGNSSQEIDITEPTYDYLESIRSNFVDEKLDAIIGMGGGSAFSL